MTDKLEKINELIQKIDGSGSDSEWDAIEELRRICGDQLPQYLLDYFQRSSQWKVRVTCVYHAIRYARRNEFAITLGKVAIKDKSKIVRYRGCMLLAYSLRKDVIPFLRQALKEVPLNSREDVIATIDAIENENHHFFVDRNHSGKVTLNIN
ncbi:MAG: hypothetical protein JW891_07465 [Candidatus Lokiarchaeota archaeon]|nr:hypothetical protein [Candidatus Lokiarchaeota archaeon]